MSNNVIKRKIFIYLFLDVEEEIYEYKHIYQMYIMKKVARNVTKNITKI